MNITGEYNLHEIIKELEIAFQIDGSDFEERDMDRFLSSIKTKINRQYNIDISEYPVNSIELDMCAFRESLLIFIENITRIHASLCGSCQISRYLTESEVSLSDVNYLGFTEQKFKETLIALQRKNTQPFASDNVQAIKTRLSSISYSWEKRLCILLVLSWEIGFPEITACIAEILYQSTLR